MLTYRAVKHTDLAELARFPQNAAELYFCCPKANFPLTEEQLTTIIASRCCSTVVEQQGQIAGFANFYQWQHRGCCKIGNVMVNPKLRQQGIARYLLSIMTLQAKNSFSAIELQVCCFNSNTIALLFYAKMGFKPIAIEERIDNNKQKVALIHMSRLI